MLNPEVDELLALFNKYKIQIDTICVGDTVHLERFGIIIPYSQKRLCEERPKKVCAEIIKAFIQHPEYKAKTAEYVKTLVKKPTIIYTNTTPVLTIDEKKKLIRKNLTNAGLIS
jgi:hypothetical protein